MAIDTVCAMAVDRGRAVSLEYDGRSQFFRSCGSRREFLGFDPDARPLRAQGA